LLRRSLIAATALVALLAPVAVRADHLGFECYDDGDAVYEIPENPWGITGKYALPASEPGAIATFAHGYGHTTDSWVEHLRAAAAEGALAFATDYRGTWIDEDEDVRGWFVREGADDSIVIAQAFMMLCHDLQTSIILGVSMGGNASGLAVAAGQTKPDGSPLFDYWIAAEPAANVIETYLEAAVVEPAVPFAAKAKADIEAQHGGTLWEQPASYAEGTIVLRSDDIVASGVQGVAVIHGFDDGLVPYNQGRELATVLRANGLPTDFYNAARRETDGTPEGSDNTTLTENAARPLLEAAGQAYTEPLAGHGTESSQTHIVIRTAFEILFDLLRGEAVPANREFVVDGEAGTIPIP